MNKKQNDNPIKYSGHKNLIFGIILIFIPFLILCLIELSLRIVHYGNNYNLFIDFPAQDFHQYRYINPEIGKKYFQKLDYNRPCDDMFLKKKPDNGFRIFVLGSSTVLGFPYNQNLMFSRILQERLQDCYPDKKIEVVNTAITAVNSFTLCDYIGDILKEDPDAILIYAGHNEFYGALGTGSVEKTVHSRALTMLHLDLLSLRLYQLLRNTISKVSQELAGNKPDNSMKGTLMKRIAANKDIAYKSKIYNTTMRYYGKNMDRILRKANRHKVPVFISEVCSNVKDLEPFCSVKTEQYPKASEIFSDASRYEKNGEFEKANELYYYAKDLDCIRFRASEEVNEMIRQLALKYSAHLVGIKEIFEKASPNGLIGNNLITEHVHPNIDGYFLMADAFFNEITASNIIGEQLDTVYYKNSSYYQKNWGYTELDSLVGKYTVGILTSGWPFQSLESTLSEKYRKTHKPESLVDSLAFAVTTSPSLKINEAHQILAEYYLNRREYFKAFEEYYSDVEFDPYQVNYYNSAIHCLTLLQDFPMALKLINTSLGLKETFYANYIKGEILFLKADYLASIKALDRAYELDNSIGARLQILISLHKVYYYSANQYKANEILAEIRKIKPDFQPVYPSEKKKYVYYVPLQVEDRINKAFDLYKSGRFDGALAEFLKTLDIKETSLADRCNGDILFTRNDSNSMLYYRKAYPDYKNDIHFLFNMEILYLQYKKTDDAIQLLGDIKKLDPRFEKIPLLEQKISELQMH
jgi:tetratricopeptide (TPR) repeat protein/lysophospholipase L1-like esterase